MAKRRPSNCMSRTMMLECQLYARSSDALATHYRILRAAEDRRISEMLTYTTKADHSGCDCIGCCVCKFHADDKLRRSGDLPQLRLEAFSNGIISLSPGKPPAKRARCLESLTHGHLTSSSMQKPPIAPLRRVSSFV